MLYNHRAIDRKKTKTILHTFRAIASFVRFSLMHSKQAHIWQIKLENSLVYIFRVAFGVLDGIGISLVKIIKISVVNQS